MKNDKKTYFASAQGFGGPVDVTAEIKDNAVVSLKIYAPDETKGFGDRVCKILPGRIIEAGSTDVDAVAGATVTSEAALLATSDILVRAGLAEEAKTAVMKPGVYEGKGRGYDWIEPVRVSVTVDEKSITGLEIAGAAKSRENHPMQDTVIKFMLPRIIESQSVGVDAITGATATSNGVKMAIKDALRQALRAGGSRKSAVHLFEKPVPKKNEKVTMNVDIAVVGMAAAGICAALAAADEAKSKGKTLNILGLDTAGKFGGVAAEIFAVNPKRYCERYNGGKPYMDNTEELYKYWTETFNHGEGKHDVIRKLFDESGNTIDWLEFDHKTYFHSAMHGFCGYTWMCKYRFQLGAGWEEGHVYEGLSKGMDRYEAMDFYYKRLVGDLEKLGGKCLTEVTGTGLLYDRAAKKVTGVKAVGADGTEYTIYADAVILGTGGFMGSPEMVEKYCNKNEYYDLHAEDMQLYGFYQNKGQMIDSALQNGAAPYNISIVPLIHLASAAGYIDKYPVNFRPNPTTGKPEMWSLNDIPLTIAQQHCAVRVGMNGRRSHNEAGQFECWKGGAVSWSIVGADYLSELGKKGFAGQTGALSRVSRIHGYNGVPCNMPLPEAFEAMDEGVKKGFIFKADTLAALAERIGVPAGSFAEEIAKYRRFCKEGADADFGKPARELVDLVGENGPYYAVKCVIAPYSSMGGLDVDTNINVLDTDGRPMPGLYACGNDSSGVLYAPDGAYAQFGGVALGWACTSGRLAGIHAANYIMDAKK